VASLRRQSAVRKCRIRGFWKVGVLEISVQRIQIAARQMIWDCEVTDSATPECLMKGAAYALEQCGLCLRDAALLYRGKSYADAVVLAAFARGRSVNGSSCSI
jgi:hypothetical protein